MTEFLVVIPIPIGSYSFGNIDIERFIPLLISINIFGIASLLYIYFGLKKKKKKFNFDNITDKYFFLSIPAGVAIFSDTLAAVLLLSYIIQILLF